MDTLSPFPEGWFFVTTRKALLREKLIEKTWMGEEVVAWCDGEGRICVADAMCPHLGSHLGPTVGGIVRDGCLVCPFHGFEFDTTGQCVATPNAPAPKAAKLKVYETREILGLVFAWYGSNDDNVNPVGSVTVDGAYLKSCFDFKRVRRILSINVRHFSRHSYLWTRLFLRRIPRENH